MDLTLNEKNNSNPNLVSLEIIFLSQIYEHVSQEEQEEINVRMEQLFNTLATF